MAQPTPVGLLADEAISYSATSDLACIGSECSAGVGSD